MNKISISAISLALSLAISIVQAGDSTFLITSGKDNYWQISTFTETSGNANITVNESQTFQKWRGFGGTFNEAGWDALNRLSDSDKQRAMRLLFDVNDGIGFTWGRIPVGASDYALERYTLNETKDDFNMEHFSIERDKQYLIPYIKAALEIKPDILFWASPWTPPTWMKNNNAFDGGEMRNDAKYFQANALYLAKFCETYNNEGIKIRAICPQNEPGYTQHYPSCGWGKYASPSGQETGNSEYLSNFVKDHFIPTIKERSPETEIWFGTLSNDKTCDLYWNGSRDKAGNQIKALGLQWNTKKLVKGAANQGYMVFNSEHKCGNYPWLNNKASSVNDAHRDNFLASMAPNNHAYGEETWDLLKEWIDEGVHSYNAWNMVLDTKGFNLDQQRKWPQNALLAVDKDARTLKVTPAYYVFRHIGQYVDTGATRLGVGNANALAFRNPNGSIVIAAFNSNNNNSQTTVSVAGKKYQFNIPGRGWATLVVNWEKPVSVKDPSGKIASKANLLRITRNADGYRVSLPSSEAGRIELLTANGRILESREISQGSNVITLQKKASYSGLLLLRVVSGGKTNTAKFFTY
jgi:glucosylceramidase